MLTCQIALLCNKAENKSRDGDEEDIKQTFSLALSLTFSPKTVCWDDEPTLSIHLHEPWRAGTRLKWWFLIMEEITAVKDI